MMGGVTRDVDVSSLQGLLADPPRATVAFVTDDGAELLPARARLSRGVYSFGILEAATGALAGREVVLMVDDGAYWFELRGVSVRGTAVRTDPSPAHAERGFAWYAIEPRRVLAWDYAAIRLL
jgi:hypothetical protein